MSDRKYPDIDFVETDTETIESNLIALYENMVQQVPGRERYKVYPASPERLFIAWVANIIVQQRVIINETAKKNVPRYADGEYLDSLAELFKDLERLPASPASAMFRFYISEAQKQSVIIPTGTRISFDGAILFETKENLEIKAGQTLETIWQQGRSKNWLTYTTTTRKQRISRQPAAAQKKRTTPVIMSVCVRVWRVSARRVLLTGTYTGQRAYHQPWQTWQ